MAVNFNSYFALDVKNFLFTFLTISGRPNHSHNEVYVGVRRQLGCKYTDFVADSKVAKFIAKFIF